MLDNLLRTLLRFSVVAIAAGLMIALFLIGIIGLWYFLLIGVAIWVFRKLQMAYKTCNGEHVEVTEPEVIFHQDPPPTQTKPKRPGRVIEHE